MLLPTLLAALAAVPAALAQNFTATPVALYPSGVIPPEGTTGTAIPILAIAPGESPANFTVAPVALYPPGVLPPAGTTGTAIPILAIAPGQPPANFTAASDGRVYAYQNASATEAPGAIREDFRNGTYIPISGSAVATTTAVGGIVYVPVPAVQNVTSTSTSASTTMSCATSMGFERASSVRTRYEFTTTTTTVRITSVTCATVTVTPTASTFTGVVTTTVLLTSVSRSTEAPTTMPTPAGFNPLFIFAPARPTAIARFRRNEIEARDAFEALALLKRQTPAGNTGGIRVNRNGTTSNIYRRFPQELICSVSITISRFVTSIEQGPTETVYAEVDAATSISTVTVSSTTTVTEVVPRETVWAACQDNNVVNSVEGTTGDTMIFDRVIFRPMEGFPLENEIIVPTENATYCCIECQKTPYCAGSIYAPSEGECHIRLTQAAESTLPSNSSTNSTSLSAPFLLPNSTASALSPTGTSPSNPLTTASPAPNTCVGGSRGFYLGTIQGQTDFPLEYALWMSNGPCGRLSVWPVPVNNSLDTSLSGPPARRALEIEGGM